MWLASDSAFLYPILIEIETPWKRWWQSTRLAQHSELTTALTQVAQWRAWFGRGRNQAAFYDYYRVPRDLQDLRLEPRFVVVHGRRSEANANPAAVDLRGALTRDSDTRLLTFNHLHADPQARGCLTVLVNEQGFSLHPNSPPEDPGEPLPPDARRAIAGLGNPQDSVGYRFRPPPRRACLTRDS